MFDPGQMERHAVAWDTDREAAPTAEDRRDDATGIHPVGISAPITSRGQSRVDVDLVVGAQRRILESGFAQRFMSPPVGHPCHAVVV